MLVYQRGSTIFLWPWHNFWGPDMGCIRKSWDPKKIRKHHGFWANMNWGKGLLPSWYPLIINIRSLLMISSLPTISCSIPMLLNITTHSYIMQLSTISNISALYANYNINIINDQYQQAASIVILGIFIYYI